VAERVTIGAPPRALEGVLDGPAGAAAGAVVCHPHPQYGGSMDVAVVAAVARALAVAGRRVLRFNFGGVGWSGGAYSGGPAEVKDVRAAYDALAARLPLGAPIAVVGYSFGSWVGLQAVAAGAPAERAVAIAPPLDLLDFSFAAGMPCPTVCLVGDADQYCSTARASALAATPSGRIAVRVLPGVDHFFMEREMDLARLVVEAVGPADAERPPG
jgi:alpha/beta superfamily hydrolase